MTLLRSFQFLLSMNRMLCIEILGESPVHKFIVQSGWSGRDYVFFYNAGTQSHIRAYRSLEDYLAERVDMHKSANIWPLLANLIPEEQLDPLTLVGEAGEATTRKPRRKG